jgi:hypothetical protein
MKCIVFLVLLFPAIAFAQNCALKSSRDPYTKEVKLATGLIALNNCKYSIEATKSDIDFMFLLDGKCFDDASTAAVFFEGTRLRSNYKNGGTTNCDGLIHFTFRNTTSTQTFLQNLGDKKVASIRFKDNTNKETGVIFTPEQQQQFMELTNCIITESKKLLQP